MLIIREQQIQHFIAENEEELIALIVQITRESNADKLADYDDQTLEKMVKIGIGRAKIYELTRAEDIAAFVAVMFEIAPNFDEQEQIKTVLADTTFPRAERFYQLFERVSEEDWKRAEDIYNVSVWFPAKQ